MDNIIFIKYSPLTQKVYNDFCMEELVKNGYSVEYWDITKLFSFSLNSFEHFEPHDVKIITVNSYKEVEVLAGQRRESFYISLMTPGLNQIRLLRSLAEFEPTIAFWGPDPVFYKKNSTGKRLKRITLGKIAWMIKHIVCRHTFRHLVKHNYDYHFNVGKMGFQALGSIDDFSRNSIKKLQMNSFDYDNFFYQEHQFELTSHLKYAVFIDQYYPFHPDMIILGATHIPYEPYFKQLNSTFDMLENKLGMRIVIAAHPKSIKYKEMDYFNGRKVYWGQTSELTKNATVVIVHDSTAVSYAIMAKKPVISLTSSLIKKYYPVNYTNCVNLSEQFGFKLIDMDDNEPCCINSKESFGLDAVQQKRYESFIYNYCTSPEIHEPNRTLLIKYLQIIANR